MPIFSSIGLLLDFEGEGLELDVAVLDVDPVDLVLLAQLDLRGYFFKLGQPLDHVGDQLG